MKQSRFLTLAVVTMMAILLAISCDKKQYVQQKEVHADSLMNAAYYVHDYDQLLSLADKLQASGNLSDIKADYWRGYAYSRLRKIRSAEMFWSKAIGHEVNNEEELEYYFKSANRLSGILLLRAEFEATMKTALPALKKMQETGHDSGGDYAYLLTTVGCCQLNVGSADEAAKTFVQAYQKYQETINQDPSKSNFTTAIVGVITITDNYLYLKRYEEAQTWTVHFDELLQQYMQLPVTDPQFIDKQQARLCFYRAWALEGLGNKKEAAKSYNEGMKLDYAKTNDGRLEAISYLMLARRTQEAAHNFEVLDYQMNEYNFVNTFDNIKRYLLPKYRVYVEAGRRDSALALGLVICNSIDSAIVKKQQDETMELATLYSTQQKEAEIAKQKADMARQKLMAIITALALIIVFFAVFYYFRQQAALHLKHAYHQLEIANARAEESSRMKTVFIQQISHEIRTPLNILSGFTQIITTPGMELDDATKQDVNQKISENTNRITGLVNKMLELSDVSSRTVIERTDTVPALQIAAQAVSDSNITGLPGVKFDLQVDSSVEPTMLTTNLLQATRALVLLLDNAQKFLTKPNEQEVNGDRGSVVLRATMNAESTAAEFIVEDTGIGVPIDEAERIFDEFVQLDDYYEGTGIGLTVARSIARRLGGDIVLDTNYTGGARFVMSLPC
ncbi:MAG: hypothetical protein IKZ48_05355 [Prevotella sp.]|nr:hypothetical protein [Prevotella sp.]